MAKITQETHVELAVRESVSLGKMRGRVLVCTRGEVWITVDGDRRDIVLSPGKRFEVASDAAAVVSAFKDSAFVVCSDAVSHSHPGRFLPRWIFPNLSIR